MLMITNSSSLVLHCPVCGAPAIFEAKAVVSPWIRQFGLAGTRKSNYLHCKICDLGFFDYRYTSREMNSTTLTTEESDTPKSEIGGNRGTPTISIVRMTLFHGVICERNP